MIQKAKAKAPSMMRHMISIAAIAACAAPGVASAFEIDTGSSDVKIRWDNTIRYNLGIRAEDCDPNICGDGAGKGDITAHQSDRKFAKAGDIIANRLDLLSEMDVIYKGDSGFRISGSGWYDQAYHDVKAKGDPYWLAAGMQSFDNGEYTGYIKRNNKGPAGQLLDAFLFTKLDLGDTSVSIKAGQHNVYWGESLFSFVGGVAYGQGPVDIRKALANPGSEAKELFLPLNQISFSTQLTDTVTLAGQYFLDWKPSTLPDGGTYFGPADFFTEGGNTNVALLGPNGKFLGVRGPKDDKGDWGLALKTRPEWLDGSASFFFREYTDKLPQMVISDVNPTTGGLGVTLDYQTPRQKMFAMSFSKQIAGISFGSDITFRKDAQIGAFSFAPVVGMPGQWRPRGDVTTALVNAIAYVGQTSLFDSAAITAELNHAHLNKVTHDPYNIYFGNTLTIDPTYGYISADGVHTLHGAPTRDNLGFAIQFAPTWFQVFPGVDIGAPMFYGVGLHGNSPVPFGDNEGQGSYSLGLTADMDAKYNFAIKYNGFLAKHSHDELGVGGNSNASLGKFWDRDFVSMTFKTTF